jgi:hypothetical protein
VSGVVLVFNFAVAFVGWVSWMEREGGGGLLLGGKVSGKSREEDDYGILHNHDAWYLARRLAS